MADFLLVLAEFDEKKLWRERGHASLFAFLRRDLGLSAGAAQYRKTAAELVRRFPSVEAALREGRLCLSSVIELGKVITPENCAQVVPRFFGLSSRDAAVVAASIRPAQDPPRRDVVTPLRLASTSTHADETPSLDTAEVAATETSSRQFRAPGLEGTATVDDASASAAAAAANPTPSAAPPHAPVDTLRGSKPMSAQPLTADLARLHVTVSRRFLAKLEAARNALSHALPGASAEDILEAGLDVILAADAKKKGLVSKPRNEPPPSTSDRIPAHVKRVVWARDEGKCQWPVASGGVCGRTERVELAHREARARGGAPTVENLRLLCRIHNQYEARLDFGEAFMERFTVRRERDVLGREVSG